MLLFEPYISNFSFISLLYENFLAWVRFGKLGRFRFLTGVYYLKISNVVKTLNCKMQSCHKEQNFSSSTNVTNYIEQKVCQKK